MLHLSKDLFPLYVNRMLYYAYIYPHLTYCMLIWGGGQQSCCSSKESCNLNYLAHVHPTAFEYKLLLIPELFIFQLMKLMYDAYYNNGAVNIISSLISLPF